MIPCAIMRVGVVGLGAIGRQLCRALDEGIAGLTLAGATARDRDAVIITKDQRIRDYVHVRSTW